MKFEYDKEVDAAYIYVADAILPGESKKTIELNNNIILDFDANSKLIGIEILDASKILNKNAIAQAELI